MIWSGYSGRHLVRGSFDQGTDLNCVTLHHKLQDSRNNDTIHQQGQKMISMFLKTIQGGKDP